MKKIELITPMIVLLALFSVSPVAAHDGDSGILSVFIGNRLLAAAAAVLSLLNVLLVVLISGKPYPIWNIGVIGLGSMAAFLHLGIGLRGDTLLLLNGFGYLALVYALLLPLPFLIARQAWTHWLLVGYTSVTFVGYFLMHGLAISDLIGLFTKILEFGLVFFLFMRMRQARNETNPTISPAVTSD